MAAKKKKKAASTKALKGKLAAQRRQRSTKAAEEAAEGLADKKFADLSATDKVALLKALALQSGLIDPD